MFLTEINSLWFGVHVLAAAQVSSDRRHGYGGKGAGRSSAGRGARPPMDPNRGGAQSKVSVLINAHRTSGWNRELWELGEQMMQTLDERRDRREARASGDDRPRRDNRERRDDRGYSSAAGRLIFCLSFKL